MSQLVTVIIPFFNREYELQRSIKSVINQTYDNLEIIVVDDGSTISQEGSVLTFGINHNKKISYIRQSNQGPGIARQKGLAAAKGKYIQYLDSDDEILPEKLEKQVRLLEFDPDAVMCYTPTIQAGKDGIYGGLRKFSDQAETDLLRGALQWRRWHTSSCLWHYPNKNKGLNYWTDLYNGEDVVHDVSAGIDTRKVLFLNEPLTVAHTGDDNLSNTPQSPERITRLASDTYRSPDLCRELLQQVGLDKDPFYAEPLAERFLYNSLKLVKMHDLDRAKEGLSLALALSTDEKRKLEIRMHLTVLGISKGYFLPINRFIFNRLHKSLFTPAEHFNRRL